MAFLGKKTIFPSYLVAFEFFLKAPFLQNTTYTIEYDEEKLEKLLF
jgi:hypothetical protein